MEILHHKDVTYMQLAGASRYSCKELGAQSPECSDMCMMFVGGCVANITACSYRELILNGDIKAAEYSHEGIIDCGKIDNWQLKLLSVNTGLSILNVISGNIFFVSIVTTLRTGRIRVRIPAREGN